MSDTITITGNLGADPELRFTPSGKSVCSFSVAVNRRKKDERGEWVDGETIWYQVTTWERQADAVAESGIGKGTTVRVTGRPKLNLYVDKQGEHRGTIDIIADMDGVSILPRPAKRLDQTTTQGGDDPWAAGAGQTGDDETPPF